VPPIPPEQAAERIRKLIIVGDNRLKQGGADRYARARGTFEQAQRLADETGLGERFARLLRARLEAIERLSASGDDVDSGP
jgi:hypothetical protein